ncbi:hypothetical protein MBAV_004033 [Candidatus Magnetobacterium bavaricum]|uniref:Uncharacterized protein n=1 Tax=Candidatus Magnetobacterium bavaricum TaxID=29290 RepID=A0A0F3GPC4_9BACT|nr:hypothetical protein MBAV_004033 [Candidatus Magnetobacterium bavaricum]
MSAPYRPHVEVEGLNVGVDVANAHVDDPRVGRTGRRRPVVAILHICKGVS